MRAWPSSAPAHMGLGLLYSTSSKAGVTPKTRARAALDELLSYARLTSLPEDHPYWEHVKRAKYQLADAEAADPAAR